MSTHDKHGLIPHVWDAALSTFAWIDEVSGKPWENEDEWPSIDEHDTLAADLGISLSDASVTMEEKLEVAASTPPSGIEYSKATVSNEGDASSSNAEDDWNEITTEDWNLAVCALAVDEKPLYKKQELPKSKAKDGRKVQEMQVETMVSSEVKQETKSQAAQVETMISKQAASPAPTKQTLNCSQIQPDDVLLGKGRRPFCHHGNKLFRQLVLKFRSKYQSTKIRDEKSRIITDILNEIERKGGRFLKLDGDNEYRGNWSPVSREMAYNKVSHALRMSKVPDPRSKPKMSLTRQIQQLLESVQSHYNAKTSM